ncbi:MAG: HAMP domain-containing sensor histidine kinase [Patescibacteria group bacterium]
MDIKKIGQQLDFFNQCKKYHLGLWQCPSFLFPLIGLITIIAIIATYLTASKYAQPEIVALIVISLAAIFLVIGYLIIRGFEKLAQANYMKSEFVSIASHQLRTPLSAIKWTINLLEKEQVNNLNGEIKDRISDIKENNQRMINLVNDLLNVSRVEQGKLGLANESFSLVKIAQELIKEYAPLAKASNLQLSLKAEPNSPLISADFQAIKLALSNLIDNAIRYTREPGKVGIKIFKKGASLKCEVKDNGVGIPKQDQNKIFQKFFRSQNVMKYQTEGTGLGLFIVRAVINESKGKIGFKSQEGQGTTFWFELPIKS